MDGLRGILAADVTGDLPSKFWPDDDAALFYERSIGVVAGPSGMGKSLSTVKIGADVSRTGGAVIYCNAEDDEVMQRYRFEAAGADLDRVLFATFIFPEDLDALEYAIRATGAKLCVFDTAEKHLNAPVARWSHPLRQCHKLMERTGCTAIFVHHTNKNVRKSADWRAAIGGATSGLVGTARSVALFGVRPDDPSQRLLCPVKDSYDETPRAIAFEFLVEEFEKKDSDDAFEVAYFGIVERNIHVTNPTELVVIQGDGDTKRGPSPEKAAEAAAFLTDALQYGAQPVKDAYRCPGCGHYSVRHIASVNGACPECNGPVTEVEGLETLADAAGISWGTAKRAKQALEVESARKGFGPMSLNYWRLPDGHPKLAPNAAQVLA